MEINKLLAQVELKAKQISDGHFTIFKFGKYYKSVFGTPDTIAGGDYTHISEYTPGFETLEESLTDLINQKSPISIRDHQQPLSFI